MKVYSVLVAYNAEYKELLDSIDQLKLQVSTVVLCNNSDFDIFIDDDNVKVFNFGDNLGIAKAQSIGMSWAYKNGADFVLQMDQDSVLQESAISDLLNSYSMLCSGGMKIGVIGPLHYDKLSGEIDKARVIKGNTIPGTACVIVNATISSCSLIPKEAYDVVGGMEDDLFIDAVDFEYCWRLKKSGFLTVRDNSVLLAHRVGDGKKKIINGVDARIPSPVRHYYHIRNLFLLLFRGYVPIYWKASNLVKLVAKLLLYPFIFKDGALRFKYMVKGIWHGVLGYYGRIDKAARKL